jgi:hypothetical protein
MLAAGLSGCGDFLTGPELHGVWGGRSVQVTVSADGAVLVHDCAAGTMDARPDPDDDGRFMVTGTRTPGVGLPFPVDDPPQPRPARYEGRISGKTMTFSVTFTDTGDFVATYEATRGQEADLFFCL